MARTRKSKAKPLPVTDQRPPIGSAFQPGVVQLTCGCSEERRKMCLQKPYRHDVHVSMGHGVVSERCHIYVTETDLIELTHTIVKARFEVQDKAAEPTKAQLIKYLEDIRDGEDIDDPQIVAKAIDVIRKEVL